MKSKYFMVKSFLLLVLISGCAKLSYRPTFYVTNPAEKKAYEALAEKVKSKDAKDVKVLVNKFPKGVYVKNGKIINKNRRLRYLGKVYAEFNRPSLFSFYPYAEDQSWRNKPCHFQQLITWVTLGIWMLSPTYWPCLVDDSSNDPQAVKERRSRMITTLQKMTYAMGGHVLVVKKVGTLKEKETKEIVNSVAAEGHAFEIIRKK